MNVQTTTASATELESDAMVAGIFSDGILGPALADLDAAMDGMIKRLIARKEISGKAAEVVRLLGPPGLQTGEVVVVGSGGPRHVRPGAGDARRRGSCQAAGRAATQRRRLLFRRRLG